jgi:hypothetical protein
MLLPVPMQSFPFRVAQPGDQIEVLLDGVPVGLPAERRSLGAIRCHLETIALQQQRILCSLHVASSVVHGAQTSASGTSIFRVEARTMELGDRALLILDMALAQSVRVMKRVTNAITLVLINDVLAARELWWDLARELKEPVLTLSLLPDNVCGPSHGQASFTKLRRWQLEQLAAIILDVDQASGSEDTVHLSDALAAHVLPWIESHHELIKLWRETVRAGSAHQTSQSC